MGTLDDGFGPNVDHAIKLCDLLGLNAEEITAVQVRIEAGVGAVVEWTGIRRVPLKDLVDALAPVLTDGKAPEPPC